MELLKGVDLQIVMNNTEKFISLSDSEKHFLKQQKQRSYYVLIAYGLVAAVAYYFASTLTIPIFAKGFAGIMLSAVAVLLVLKLNKINSDLEQGVKRVLQGVISSKSQKNSAFFWEIASEKVTMPSPDIYNQCAIGDYVEVCFLPHARTLLSFKPIEKNEISMNESAQETAVISEEKIQENSENASYHIHQEALTSTDLAYIAQQKKLLVNQNLIAALFWGGLTFFAITMAVRFMADNSSAGRWDWASNTLPILGTGLTLWFAYKQFQGKYSVFVEAAKQNSKKIITTTISDKLLSNKNLSPYLTIQGHLSSYKNYLKIDNKFINTPESIYKALAVGNAVQLHFLMAEADVPFLLVLDFKGQKKAFFVEQ